MRLAFLAITLILCAIPAHGSVADGTTLSTVTVRVIVPATTRALAPTLRISSLDHNRITRTVRMSGTGRLMTGSFRIQAGYYKIEARASGLEGVARVAVANSEGRNIVLSLRSKEDVSNGGHSSQEKDTGALVARAPEPHVRVYAERVDGSPESGTWLLREGNAFYADDLAAGRYRLTVHFDNCCGFTQDVTIKPNLVTQTAIDLSRYYAQTFARLTTDSEIFGVAVGLDGTPWFVESLGVQTRIGHRLSDGRLVEWAPPIPPSAIWDLTPRPDGSLWFLEAEYGVLGKVDANGKLHEYQDTQQHSLTYFRFSQDGSIWLLTADGMAVEHMTSKGSVHVFRLNSVRPDEEVRGLVVAPDGALWFTDYDGNRVIRIDSNGENKQFSIPWTCGPVSLYSWGARFALECEAGPYAILSLDTAGNFVAVASNTYRTTRLMVVSDDLLSINRNGVSVDRFASSGSIHSYPVARSNPYSAELIPTPHHLWYFDGDRNKAADLEEPTSGNIAFSGPIKDSDYSVAPDGAVWFSIPKSMLLVRLGDDRSVSTYTITPKPPRQP